MNTKKDKIIYWGATGLFSALTVVSTSMYFFNHQVALDAFVLYGFPTYIIYPLGIAKMLGLLAILTRKSELLKNLAYAGFFYNGLLALSAHMMAGEPLSGYVHAVVFLIFVVTSYFYEKKVFGKGSGV